MNKKSQSLEEFKKEVKEKYAPTFLDKMGKEISVEEFGRLADDPNYKVLKQEYIENIMVSTIWLGLVNMHGKLFETMLFVEGYSSSVLDCSMWRYHTLKEAEQGHDRIVKNLKKFLEKYPTNYEKVKDALEKVKELENFIA